MRSADSPWIPLSCKNFPEREMPPASVSCKLFPKQWAQPLQEQEANSRLRNDLLSQWLLHYSPADPEGNPSKFDGLPFNLLPSASSDPWQLISVTPKQRTSKFQKFAEQITHKVRQNDNYACSNWFTSFWVSKLKKRLCRLVWVYTCQNTTLLEITCRGLNACLNMLSAHSWKYRKKASWLPLHNRLQRQTYL